MHNGSLRQSKVEVVASEKGPDDSTVGIQKAGRGTILELLPPLVCFPSCRRGRAQVPSKVSQRCHRWTLTRAKPRMPASCCSITWGRSPLHRLVVFDRVRLELPSPRGVHRRRKTLRVEGVKRLAVALKQAENQRRLPAHRGPIS